MPKDYQITHWIKTTEQVKIPTADPDKEYDVVCGEDWLKSERDRINSNPKRRAVIREPARGLALFDSVKITKNQDNSLKFGED